MTTTHRAVILVVVAMIAIFVGLLLPHFDSNIVFYVGLAVAAVGVVTAAIGPWNRALAAIARIVAASWRLTAYSLIVFGLIVAASNSCVYLDGNDKPDRTKMDVLVLTLAAKTYSLKHGGETPANLEAVLPYVTGGSEMDLLDAWGRRYDYDPNGPRNRGKQPDIWTVSPSGELIGNWVRP